MEHYKQVIGKKGEDIAAEYLCAKGYQIVERNYKYGRNEIDLIAVKDKMLLFVEVKTRTSITYGYPEKAVNRQKAANIKKAAGFYMEQVPEYPLVRFDIVAVVAMPDGSHEIEHIEDAFY